MSDWTIPIHTGCSCRECLSAFVAGFMKGSAVVVSLIVAQ